MSNKPNFDTWWKAYKAENCAPYEDKFNLNIVSDAFYACYRIMEEEFKHQIQAAALMAAWTKRLDPLEMAIQTVQGQTAQEIARLDKDKEKLQEKVAKLEETVATLSQKLKYMEINMPGRIYR